jgi:predicted glycosyltransferase
MLNKNLLQTLRRATALARWVLLGFVLSLGVAIASPIVNPQATQLICSGSGVMKVIVISADGSTEVTSQSMDCPLCVSIISPTPIAPVAIASPAQQNFKILAFHTIFNTKPSTSPPPARGPPDFL